MTGNHPKWETQVQRRVHPILTLSAPLPAKQTTPPTNGSILVPHFPNRNVWMGVWGNWKKKHNSKPTIVFWGFVSHRGGCLTFPKGPPGWGGQDWAFGGPWLVEEEGGGEPTNQFVGGGGGTYAGRGPGLGALSKRRRGTLWGGGRIFSAGLAGSGGN